MRNDVVNLADLTKMRGVILPSWPTRSTPARENKVSCGVARAVLMLR
jgi:hypothetical protein